MERLLNFWIIYLRILSLITSRLHNLYIKLYNLYIELYFKDDSMTD